MFLPKIEIDCIRSVSRKIHFHCINCDIVATINGLREELTNVKSELNALKNEQGKAIDRDTNKNLLEENIISEIEDRNRRACNLILLNLPESAETI